MCPSEGRSVLEELWWAFEFVIFSGLHSFAEVFCIPVNYDGSEQVQASHSVMLGLCGSVADLTLAANSDGIF